MCRVIKFLSRMYKSLCHESIYGRVSFIRIAWARKMASVAQLVRAIDILYTLDSASYYSAIQKLKPWLQTQDIPMKWKDSYVFYFLNRELKHEVKPIPNTFSNYSNDESYCCFLSVY
jgi:hypothetical protein